MAIQSLGQLLLDHGPEVQRLHHEQLVPALRSSMDLAVNPSPRVRSHAASALINFTDFLERDQLTIYLDGILFSAVGAMQAGPRVVQEQVLKLFTYQSKSSPSQWRALPLALRPLLSCPALPW
jgi:hypothetical protein